MSAETPDPPVPLFEHPTSGGAALALRIEAPWRSLKRLPEDEGPFPATLTVGESGEVVPLTIEKRGISRQQICRMPPIRLRFDEEAVAGTPFEGNRSIKVVTHCRRGGRYERYVALEFLAYRLYNVVTEMSFRVRSATVIYEDNERSDRDGPRIAFLIEDDRLVGNRHGLDKVDISEVRPSNLPALESSVFALFQYMIGNVDFSPLSSSRGECCHNAKLIGDEETLEPVYAVPYDFDSSGWVDADYAAPPENLPLRNVRERLFRGFCVHNEGLQPARELFQARRQALSAVVESEPRLSARERGRAQRYLDEFFEVLNDDRRFEREITGACRS